MKIKAIRWKKWLVVTAVILMFIAGPINYLANRYVREIQAWKDRQVRWTKYRMGSGIKADLARGRVKAGDDLDSVLSRFPLRAGENQWNGYRLDFLQWSQVTYEDDSDHVALWAKDGKIVRAEVWNRTFQNWEAVFPCQLSPREIAMLDDFSVTIFQNRHQTHSTLISFLTGNAVRVYLDEEKNPAITPPLFEEDYR